MNGVHSENVESKALMKNDKQMEDVKAKERNHGPGPCLTHFITNDVNINIGRL